MRTTIAIFLIVTICSSCTPNVNLYLDAINNSNHSDSSTLTGRSELLQNRKNLPKTLNHQQNDKIKYIENEIYSFHNYIVFYVWVHVS
jgi:hypothetical protein